MSFPGRNTLDARECREPGPVEQSGPSVVVAAADGLVGLGVARVDAVVSIPSVHPVLVFFVLRRVVVDNGWDSY